MSSNPVRAANSAAGLPQLRMPLFAKLALAAPCLLAAYVLLAPLVVLQPIPAALPRAAPPQGFQSAFVVHVSSTPAAPTPPPRCSHVWPLHGLWDPAHSPFFFPEPGLCVPPTLLTPASLLACLDRRGRNRRAKIFFAGNSFARGFAFTLQSFMLGAPETQREVQTAKCAKADDGIHERCSLALTPDGATTTAFMWRDAWGDTVIDRADWCHNKSAVACHADFFGATDPGDILITNIARGYMEAFISKQRHLNNVSYELVMHDVEQFVSSGVFGGETIWTTSPRAHPDKTYGSYNGYSDDMNVFFATRLREKGITVLDHAHFITDSPPELTWVDSIHPPMESYLAVLLYALGDACDGAKVM